MLAIGDANTGLAQTAEDTLHIYTGGAQRITINSSGNVGIGTTSPGAKLDVRGAYTSGQNVVGQFLTDSTFDDTSGKMGIRIGRSFDAPDRLIEFGYGSAGSFGQSPYFYVSNGNDAGSLVENMRITHDGKMGVGTTSPSTILDIAQKADSSGITLRGYDDVSAFTMSSSIDSSGNTNVITSGAYQLISNSLISLSAIDTLQLGSGDSLSLISSADINMSSATNTTLALGDTAGTYQFEITDAGSSVVSTIDSDGNGYFAGNVGIGTTVPSQKLHVAGNARITGALYDSSNSAGSSGNILTSTGTGTAWTSLSTSLDGTYFKQDGNSFGGLATLGTNDVNALAFETNDTERVRITSAGNVGIGTTSIPTGTRLKVYQTSANSTYNDVVIERASGRAVLDLVGDGDTEVYSEISFQNRATGNGWFQSYRADSASSMYWHYYNGTTYTDALRLETDGSVAASKSLSVGYGSAPTATGDLGVSGKLGIGVLNPTHPLEIQGTVGDVYVNDNGNLLGFTRGAANYIHADTVGGYFNFVVDGASLSDANSALTIQHDYDVVMPLGRVGIQDAAPYSALQVGDDSTGNNWITIGRSGTAEAGIQWYRAGTAIDASVYVSSDERFHISNDFGGDILLDNGDVGIGTTDAAEKLHVSGNVMIGDTTGGTHSGNMTFTDSDQFPAFRFRSGTTTKAQFLANVSTSQLYIDIPAGISFRNTVGGGGGNHMIIESDGDVGIGNSTASYKLDIAGDANVTGCYRDTGTNVAGTCASDERLKFDIEEIPDALDVIAQLNPSTYQFYDSKYGPGLQYGLIAQEVEQIKPEWVETDAQTGLKSVFYGQNLTMYALAGVKQLNEQLASVTLTETGSVQLTQNSDQTYTATQVSTETPITTISAFAESVIANLKAGTANIRSLTAGSIKTDTLTSPYVSSQFIQAETVVATTVTATNTNTKDLVSSG